ncbi:MAG: ilvE 2 [Bacteriovoracaceae bacterium]|nr:ilvE 2 [Bacteriovoracaceae bacterium]
MLFSDIEGKISSQAPSVSLLDHGFLFGDSLYEVVRLYDRKILAWAEHRDRLLRGGDKLGIDIRSYLPTIEKRMSDLLISLTEPSAALRMIITRGVGKLHIDYRTCAVASIYMAAWKFDLAAQPKEVRLWVSTVRRNAITALDPSIKSGNYLNNVMAYKEALENKFDDAVMLNPENEVTELTTSNIGWIKAGKVFTPRIDAGILHGITRKLLLEVVDITEDYFELEDLMSADEVFALSTFKEVVPVVEIGTPEGQRKTFSPGAVTLKLQLDLRKKIEKKLADERVLF